MGNNKSNINALYDLKEVELNNPITISGNGQNSKSQLKLFIVLFALFVILSTSIALYFTPKNTFSTRFNNDNSDSSDVSTDNYRTGASTIPKVINVPPSYGYVNEEYLFAPKIVDVDSPREEIEIYYISGPDWLLYEKGRFYGTPTEESVTAEKVEYEIFDRQTKVKNEFYIFIYPTREVESNGVN